MYINTCLGIPHYSVVTLKMELSSHKTGHINKKKGRGVAHLITMIFVAPNGELHALPYWEGGRGVGWRGK